jgi:DNA polymerase-3 subunit gamma/tau
MAHLRDLLVVKVSGDARILDSASTASAALKQQADQFSESDLVRFFHALAETETTLKEAANPRYQVEVALVRLMEMRRLGSLGELVQRITALESALRTGNPPAQSSTPRANPAASNPSSNTTSSKPAKGTAAAEVAATDTANTAESSFFNQLKAHLEQKRRRLMIAALESALRTDLEGDEFVVEFALDAKHYRDTLARSDNAKALREACADICGKEIGIRFVIKSETGSTSVDSPAPPTAEARQKVRQAVAGDPAIQQVQRTFGAEIVDVKPL